MRTRRRVQDDQLPHSEVDRARDVSLTRVARRARPSRRTPPAPHVDDATSPSRPASSSISIPSVMGAPRTISSSAATAGRSASASSHASIRCGQRDAVASRAPHHPRKIGDVDEEALAHPAARARRRRRSPRRAGTRSSRRRGVVEAAEQRAGLGRAPARSAGSSAGSGNRSSRYSMITADSGKRERRRRAPAPCRAGSARRARRGGWRGRSATVSYSTPFSASASRTRAQNGQRARRRASRLEPHHARDLVVELGGRAAGRPASPPSARPGAPRRGRRR